jgi:uncharacterized membrane protein
MEPLLALLGVTAAVWALGRRRVPFATALRAGVAAMFVLTGAAHFIGLREELISMVPPALPAPELLVTATGLLELAGAIGLFVPRLAVWAAGGLALLLIAMFPANVYAAQAGILDDWWSQLGPRTVLQLIFLAAVTTVLIDRWRARSGVTTPVRRRSLQT